MEIDTIQSFAYVQRWAITSKQPYLGDYDPLSVIFPLNLNAYKTFPMFQIQASKRFFKIPLKIAQL